MNQQYTPEQIDHILSKVSICLHETDMSVRARNLLIKDGNYFVGNVLLSTEFDLLKINNFGRKSLNELREDLEDMGLKIGQFAQFKNEILKDFSSDSHEEDILAIHAAYSKFFGRSPNLSTSVKKEDSLNVTIHIDPNLYDINSDKGKLSADFGRAVAISLEQFARQRMLNGSIPKQEGTASDASEHDTQTTPVVVGIPKSLLDQSPLKLDFLRVQSKDPEWQKKISDEINQSMAGSAYDQTHAKLAYLEKAYRLGMEKS